MTASCETRARRLSPLGGLVGLVLLVAGGSFPAARAAEGLVRLATFACEVTPPAGHPLCGGWIQPLIAVDDPLLAKGVILEDARGRYVICAVDWCLLQTTAHDWFRRKLAAAAGIPETQATVHTVHQHNAPIADLRAQQLLDASPGAPRHLDPAFLEEVTDRVANAVRQARERLQPITHVGHGRARVERFASNRRVRLADGAIHVRYSSTKDPVLQAAPEGLIDPWLRTVSFFSGDRPIARLHYYATHPMSYYGDGRATADTVGLARERLEREEGAAQIYFTGCGGNITAGKYNDGSPQARVILTDRIAAAMRRAAADTTKSPLTGLDWKMADAVLAIRTEPEWSEAKARAVLADANAPSLDRLKASLDLAWLERFKAQPVVSISSLRMGPVNLLHLPAEAFVEFQLYAQSLRPDEFVAVAAYGESGPGYFCCDAALQEGGYEPTMSRVGPPSEFRLKAAIAGVLGTTVPPGQTPFYPDKLRLLAWRDARGFEQPVKSPEDWARRRAHILDSFEQIMGPPPASRPGQGATDHRVEMLSEEQLPGLVRRHIRLTTPDGDLVPAYVLLPAGNGGKRPAMLCLHQTTAPGKAEPAGLAGNTNLHYALELARRGFVTLSPDYPNFGEYRADPYATGYASATMKGIVNHRRAVDVLQSLPEVDGDRIGAIGHSLGGHNALFVAAFDARIKAVVTSCGFNSFFKYMGGDLAGWSHAGYMPRIASQYGKDPGRMPFDFTEVLASLAPRPVFLSAPMGDANFEVSGVKDCVIAAAPVYALFSAETNLVARHPACAHEFPGGVREEAYQWLERVLRLKP